MGDSKPPLYTTFTSNAINIALDPILIFAVGWGVHGAAVATVFAQVTSESSAL